MPGSVVIDTALGLAFVFLTVSLIASGAIEWMGNRLNKRGEYLLRGLREMLDIPPATPEKVRARGTVPTAGMGGLMETQVRRDMMRWLSFEGARLPQQLASTKDEVTLPAPMADLVLSHPIIVALHRPGRPGRPAAAGKLPFARAAATAGPTADDDATAGDGAAATAARERAGGVPGRRVRWWGDWSGWTARLRRGRDMHLASYVSARAFARSLIDLLVADRAGRTTIDELTERVQRLPAGVPARSALLALLRDGTDVDRFRADLEQWYDEHMGRVSGWYKRWAQWRLFIVGAILAVVANIDSIAIGRSLYQDHPVRAAVVAQAVSAQGCPEAAGPEREACVKRQMDLLRDLSVPIGWSAGGASDACQQYSQGRACWPRVQQWVPFWWDALGRAGVGAILLKLLGWLLTAAAVSFGAPFWFDALSKLGSLRVTGRRPGENAPYSPASSNPKGAAAGPSA